MATRNDAKRDERAEEEAPGRVVAADALEGGKVVSPRGEDLGIIEEIMIDVQRGTVAYAVMACGFPDLGEKRVAIPWNALKRDDRRECFVLDSDRGRLEQAPGLTYR
jgi:sporulation protein YlmC with PRC-barrel domain